MQLSKKIILISALIATKVIVSACDLGSTDSSSSGSSSSGSSGSSSSSFTLKPKTHNTSYANCSETQSATICQGADVRYDQYEECMNLHDGSPDCDGYYTPNYTETAKLCMSTVAAIGC